MEVPDLEPNSPSMPSTENSPDFCLAACSKSSTEDFQEILCSSSRRETNKRKTHWKGSTHSEKRSSCKDRPNYQTAFDRGSVWSVEVFLRGRTGWNTIMNTNKLIKLIDCWPLGRKVGQLSNFVHIIIKFSLRCRKNNSVVNWALWVTQVIKYLF